VVGGGKRKQASARETGGEGGLSWRETKYSQKVKYELQGKTSIAFAPLALPGWACLYLFHFSALGKGHTV